MRLILSTLKKVLFWSYERGRWQYDVMCVLILAFIFLFPNRLVSSRPSPDGANRQAAQFVAREELAQSNAGASDEAVRRFLSGKRGYEVEISRIKPVMDETGSLIGYLVWEK